MAMWELLPGPAGFKLGLTDQLVHIDHLTCRIPHHRSAIGLATRGQHAKRRLSRRCGNAEPVHRRLWSPRSDCVAHASFSLFRAAKPPKLVTVSNRVTTLPSLSSQARRAYILVGLSSGEVGHGRA